MIQRYGLFGAYDDWKMEPDSDGEFVLFSEHVAEVERLKSLLPERGPGEDDARYERRLLLIREQFSRRMP